MSTQSLSGQVALVTGGAAGIGAAIARALLDAGAEVAVVDSNLDQVDATQLLEGPHRSHVVAYCCDVTDANAIRQTCIDAEASLGKVGILINNAGGSGRVRVDHVEDLADGVWDDILSLNVGSAMRFARGLVPGMKSLGAGRIINLSTNLRNGVSAASAIPGARLPYIVSKNAVIGLTKQLAKDLAAWGITVNAVAPGFTLPNEGARITRNFRSLPFAQQKAILGRIPAGRPGSGEDVANAVRFLASPDSAFISGEVIAVTGGADD